MDIASTSNTPPSATGQPQVGLFSRRLLGGSCIVMLALLLLLFVFALFEILPLLTKPTGFIAEYMKHAPPDLQASFVVALGVW